MNLSPMDYIRAAIAQAMAEGLDVSEIWLAVDSAETPSQFDANISAIVAAKDAMGVPGQPRAFDSMTGEWG